MEMEDKSTEIKTGIELIAAERERQIAIEGFDETHDNGHDAMELSEHAGCYIASAINKTREHSPARFEVEFSNRYKDAWTWGEEYDKRDKHDTIKSLVIAGALIAAEIDRLQNVNND